MSLVLGNFGPRSPNFDIGGEGARPTLKTSRMSVYLSDTGISMPRSCTTLTAPALVTVPTSAAEGNPLSYKEISPIVQGHPLLYEEIPCCTGRSLII